MIGERERARGFAFAGVDVIPADDPDAARAAWRMLAAEVRLVILTAAAHAAVEAELAEPDERLWVVVPE